MYAGLQGLTEMRCPGMILPATIMRGEDADIQVI